MTDENSNEINLVIENTSPEFEPEYNTEDIDEEETEDEDTEGVAGVSIALGLGFDDLAGMVRTVETADVCNIRRKRRSRAGYWSKYERPKCSIRVAGDEPKKKVVSALMDDYFAAFHRKKREAGETDEPVMKAPKDFDLRSFCVGCITLKTKQDERTGLRLATRLKPLKD